MAKTTVTSLVTPAAIESVLTLIVEGQLLRQAAKLLNLPESSLYRALHADPELWSSYKRARELGANAMAEQAVDIADNDTDAKRARNRIMVRQWLAGKLDPKTYGDRLDLNVTQTVDISGALSDARTRVRPLRDQSNVIDAVIVSESTRCEPGSSDKESPAPRKFEDLL